jgi:hypothetical protein
MPTLVLTKAPKSYDGEKDSLFKNCCLEKWLSACQKLKLNPCLSPSTSINAKWIKYLNFRPEVLRLIQEIAGTTMEAISVSKDFFSRTQVAQQLRERNDK